MMRSVRYGDAESGFAATTIEDERCSEAMTIVKRGTMARNRGAFCEFSTLGLIGPQAHKCLVRNGGYINVPPRRDLKEREGSGRRWGTGIVALGVAERAQAMPEVYRKLYRTIQATSGTSDTYASEPVGCKHLPLP